MTFVPVGSVPEVIADIEKKNNKLRRAGSTEFFSYSVGAPEWIKVGDKLREAVDVTVTFPVIKVGDELLVAKLVKEEAGILNFRIAGSEAIPTPDHMFCDECEASRHRKETYLLLSPNGSVRQLGGSCVQSFLGLNAPLIHSIFEDSEDLFEEYRNNWASSDCGYPVDLVLQVATVLTDGGNTWVSKSLAAKTGATPSGSEVSLILSEAGSKKFGEHSLKIDEKEVLEAVEKVRSLVASSEDSEWIEKLRVLISGKVVSSRYVGLLASAVTLLREQTEGDTEWTAGFVGEIGDKITKQEVELISVSSFEAPGYSYNQPVMTKYLLTMRDKEGHKLVHFASRPIRVEKGVITVRSGRIKKHDVFKGVNQTVVTNARFDEFSEESWNELVDRERLELEQSI